MLFPNQFTTVNISLDHGIDFILNMNSFGDDINPVESAPLDL